MGSIVEHFVTCLTSDPLLESIKAQDAKIGVDAAYEQRFFAVQRTGLYVKMPINTRRGLVQSHIFAIHSLTIHISLNHTNISTQGLTFKDDLDADP